MAVRNCVAPSFAHCHYGSDAVYLCHQGVRTRGRTSVQLGFTGTLIVLLITTLAGTGFVIGLLLLVWSLLGGMLPQVLLFLTVFSGIVALIGIIILSLFKGGLQQED